MGKPKKVLKFESVFCFPMIHIQGIIHNCLYNTFKFWFWAFKQNKHCFLWRQNHIISMKSRHNEMSMLFNISVQTHLLTLNQHFSVNAVWGTIGVYCFLVQTVKLPVPEAASLGRKQMQVDWLCSGPAVEDLVVLLPQLEIQQRHHTQTVTALRTRAVAERKCSAGA